MVGNKTSKLNWATDSKKPKRKKYIDSFLIILKIQHSHYYLLFYLNSPWFNMAFVWNII